MLDLFRRRPQNLKNDSLSGLTVALALVPEAVAFAFVAGVSPLIGLYSAFFLCLIAAVVGGRPGMISGATGAMAVVVVTLVTQHGIEYMFPAVILCGLIQIGVGMGRLGRLIRMVPHPVMLGFVNGLALVILLAQFGSFKHFGPDRQMTYLQGPMLWVMLGLVGFTMAIIWLLPKLTRALPASLVAILVVTGIALVVNYNQESLLPGQEGNLVMTVGDMLRDNALAQAAVAQDAGEAAVVAAEAGLAGGLPRPFFMEYVIPPLNFQTLWIILPYALTLAGVGLIESLMTLTLVDEITETRGQSNRECIGQGTANIVCGLFGGMGGCAMIGQSLINVNSGGRGRLSGIVAAVCLLMFVLFLAPWIEMIPMAALVGVMFMVVIGTFEWSTLKIWGKVPASDYLVMLLVAGYTVFMHDLATAVILGVIMSALVFAWRHSTHMGADIKHAEDGSKIYQLHGPLFFASVSSFKEMFDPREDPQQVVIDFYYTRVYDQSGLEAINFIADRYRQRGKQVRLTHLSPECRRLLDRAGELIEVSRSPDPQFHLATERLA